jgi:hypothetical protein
VTDLSVEALRSQEGLPTAEEPIPSTTEDETSSSLVPGAERLLGRRSFRDALT